MELQSYYRILQDKSFLNYRKMVHKYGNFREFLELLREYEYCPLPIRDFQGEQAVFLRNRLPQRTDTIRLMAHHQGTAAYGLLSAEEEIAASNAIENIHFSRKSIRNILRGLAPQDEMENRILGQKKGLEFIADPANPITAENLHRLYQMMVGDFLPEEDRLLPGRHYRHDAVFVVGGQVEHRGLDHRRLEEYMGELLAFINRRDELSDLDKGAVIHFYLVHLHPYFDGNGRMARMLHLWYLVQRGYAAALFVPFSSLIERSRGDYYKAISQVEENQKISGVLDVTPFLAYFSQAVYGQIPEEMGQGRAMEKFEAALRRGALTQKESQLWGFVVTHYGAQPFSTKQLERDFGNAAYATIRGFVLKFQGLGLLEAQRYGNRVKYRIAE